MGLYHAIAADNVPAVLALLAAAAWDGSSVVCDNNNDCCSHQQWVAPLVEAVRLQSPNVLRALLLQLSNTNNTYSALHVACRIQDVSAVKLLLLAQEQRQAAGMTNAAAEAENANVKAGTTPLWVALEYQDKNPNNNSNDATVSIVSLLLAHGASPHIMRHGRTLLHEAAAAASPSRAVKLCQLFIQYAADVHRRSSRCVTLLQMAARRDNPTLVQVLLRAGACINPSNPEVRICLRSSLLPGMSQQSLRSLQAFLENGVNPNTFGSDGSALLHWAVQQRIDLGDIITAHGRALQQPPPPHDEAMTAVKQVLGLLTSFGAKVDLPERQAPHETPLLMA